MNKYYFKERMFIMKLSKGNFITVRDRITSESLSQQILLQSGQLKRFGAGIYAKNNFIVKVQSNVENIIREVMEKYDSVEVSMPLLQPKSLWESSGRWEGYNTSGQMFHCDMNNGIYCMAPTAEEAVVEFVKSSIKSYKDLPINIYQIGTKFRNELRARGGLFRSKEFTMMDAYSFHNNTILSIVFWIFPHTLNYITFICYCQLFYGNRFLFYLAALFFLTFRITYIFAVCILFLLLLYNKLCQSYLNTLAFL